MTILNVGLLLSIQHHTCSGVHLHSDTAIKVTHTEHCSHMDQRLSAGSNTGTTGSITKCVAVVFEDAAMCVRRLFSLSEVSPVMK